MIRQTHKQKNRDYNFIYIYFARLFVGWFASNKSKNCWTERVRKFWDNSHDPEEGLWLVETIHMTQRKVYVFSRQFTWHRGRFMSSRDISHNPEEGLCLVEIIHMTQRKVYVFSRQFTWHIGKVYGLLRQSTWPRGRFMACRDNSHDTWGRFMACRDNWHDQEEGLCLVETIISIS